ncbi:hypothetical protein Ctob_008918 [Chrysochromulina tobinii]|uniref:C2 domain-containing protein n=1 Tax=Chrysochromulina tobinii TaxID=1460289 RepID=A0A0M0K4C4_9EUKA|nr:hypothetical protein Ctob_008918 [Chrysochromulina tobinii]|eukprot:KOO33228.1 hypothetical protein Ctob_008918 [Chrysochromulina sp. CCMP291]
MGRLVVTDLAYGGLIQAAGANIREGDQLLSINGNVVESLNGFVQLLSGLAGELVFELLRSEGPEMLDVPIRQASNQNSGLGGGSDGGEGGEGFENVLDPRARASTLFNEAATLFDEASSLCAKDDEGLPTTFGIMLERVENGTSMPLVLVNSVAADSLNIGRLERGDELISIGGVRVQGDYAAVVEQLTKNNAHPVAVEIVRHGSVVVSTAGSPASFGSGGGSDLSMAELASRAHQERLDELGTLSVTVHGATNLSAAGRQGQAPDCYVLVWLTYYDANDYIEQWRRSGTRRDEHSPAWHETLFFDDRQLRLRDLLATSQPLTLRLYDEHPGRLREAFELLGEIRVPLDGLLHRDSLKVVKELAGTDEDQPASLHLSVTWHLGGVPDTGSGSATRPAPQPEYRT